MADSITSLLEIRARQEALPSGSLPVLSLDDLLYVVHGVGSNRDTVWTIAEFIAFLVAHEKFDVLKLVKDSNNDITIKWDATNNEFVIWDRSNDNGKVVAVPKFHAHGNATFDKDVSVNADLTVSKTLNVTQGSTFGMASEFNDYIISKRGLDSRGKSVFQRINMGSDKSYFETSTSTSIETLLADNSIDPSKGDIVVVRNVSGGIDLDITVGTYDHTQGQDYVATLKAYCAMAFVNTGVTGNGLKWAPLGSAEVAVV